MTRDDVQRTSQLHPVQPRARVRWIRPLLAKSTTIARLLLATSLLSSSLLSACCHPVSMQARSEPRHDSSLTPYEDVLQDDVEDSINSRVGGDVAGDTGLHEDSVRKHSSKRALSSLEAHKWDEATVPYTFDSMFPVSARKKVLRAISHWHKYTCVRFVPHSTEPYFIRFRISDYCAAAVGRQVYLENEGQEVSLTPSCAETRGNIIHELGHVVGLWHEVTRYDRDDYIEILWRNIRRGAEIWFRTVSKEATDALGTAYDLGSIMHFSPEEYAVKGKVAFRVQPNITYNGVVGQRDSLSSSDIYKISLLYGCDSLNATYVEPESLDVIRAGNKIAFKAIESDRHIWMGCNSDQCSLDTCPGKRFRPEREAACSKYVFAFYNVDGSKKLLVGNRVILRTYVNMSDGVGKLISCDGDLKECSASESCQTNSMFTAGECRDKILVLNVPGKSPGEELEHKDQIILSYDESTSPFGSWVICGLDRSTCSRYDDCDGENVVSSGDGLECGIPKQIFEVFKLL